MKGMNPLIVGLMMLMLVIGFSLLATAPDYFTQLHKMIFAIGLLVTASVIFVVAKNS